MNGCRTNSSYVLVRLQNYLTSRDVPESLYKDMLSESKICIDKEERYPVTVTDNILVKASQFLGDDLLGLKSGTYFHSLKFGLFHSLLGQAESLEHCFNLSSRYLALETQVARNALIKGPEVSHLAFFPSTQEVSKQHIDTVITQGLMRVYRSNPDWVKVQLSYDDESRRDEYEEILGCPVEFNAQYHAICLKTEHLKFNMGGYDHEMMEALEKVAKKRLQDLVSVTSIVDEVQFHTRQHLLSGQSDLSGVASRIDISERSLQKMLQSEKTTYREIVNKVRKELALELLHDPSLQPCTIAEKLGFEELSSFYRFFKKMTGCSVRDIRLSISA